MLEAVRNFEWKAGLKAGLIIGIPHVVSVYGVAWKCGVYKVANAANAGLFYEYFKHGSQTQIDKCWDDNKNVIILGVFSGLALGTIFLHRVMNNPQRRQ